MVNLSEEETEDTQNQMKPKEDQMKTQELLKNIEK